MCVVRVCVCVCVWGVEYAVCVKWACFFGVHTIHSQLVPRPFQLSIKRCNIEILGEPEELNILAENLGLLVPFLPFPLLAIVTLL